MSQRSRIGVRLCAGLLVLLSCLAGASQAAEIWVTNMKSANVQVFDPATLTLLATIPADNGAHNVTFSPDEKLAFIANVGANNVTIIDAVKRQALGHVPAGTRAHQVAVSPDGKLALVSNPGSGDITLIDVPQRQAMVDCAATLSSRSALALCRRREKHGHLAVDALSDLHRTALSYS